MAKHDLTGSGTESSLSARVFDACLDKARAVMREAADRWSRGDPEEPTNLEVVLEILRIFAGQGFLLFPEKKRRPADTRAMVIPLKAAI